MLVLVNVCVTVWFVEDLPRDMRGSGLGSRLSEGGESESGSEFGRGGMAREDREVRSFLFSGCCSC